jgi:TAT (twin-arginine translocation) pathway signal sequence
MRSSRFVITVLLFGPPRPRSALPELSFEIGRLPVSQLDPAGDRLDPTIRLDGYFHSVNRPVTEARVRITRRQLLVGGAGAVAAGVLGGCGNQPSGFTHRQTANGKRVTSGRSISVQFDRNVASGSLLVAVISRLSRRTLAPTIGQVSDDVGNHWKQAVELFSDSHYGADIWYCESATGRNRPIVTAIGLDYPVLPGISGMNMSLLEYSGASGYQLCDQIGQAVIRTDHVSTTSNFPLRSNNELAISVVVGDMDSARAPQGWNTRLADLEQGCFIADNLDTGSTAGRRLATRWTGLDGATRGSGILATFVPTGVSASSRRLVQSSYTDSAVLPAGAGHQQWRSQRFPVDPKPGNTLVSFMNGSIYHPNIDCGSIISVADTAGGKWYKAGQSGPDDHTGINISCWVCDSAVGGPTALLPMFTNSSQQLACLLLEFENLPSDLTVQALSHRTFGGDRPYLRTERPVSMGDIAFAFRTSIFVLPQGPGSPQWTQIMSDTTGANALMMLQTEGGPLTASWSGAIVNGDLDILLLALTGRSH